MALLIRECGTDARTGINSRVGVLVLVLGTRARSYVWCASKGRKRDSVAGAKGAQGRVTEQNSDCRRRCRNAILLPCLPWCTSRNAAEKGKQRSTGADAINSYALHLHREENGPEAFSSRRAA